MRASRVNKYNTKNHGSIVWKPAATAEAFIETKLTSNKVRMLLLPTTGKLINYRGEEGQVEGTGNIRRSRKE